MEAHIHRVISPSCSFFSFQIYNIARHYIQYSSHQVIIYKK
jgi:hypothetical protein